MGIKVKHNIHIKKKIGSVSGVLSHTEMRPIIMPGVYQPPRLNKQYTQEEIKKIVTMPTTRRLPADFWEKEDVLIKYTDTGRKVAIKNNNKSFLIEFQSVEFEKEELLPNKIPGESSDYFNLINEHYQVIKSGETEAIIFPNLMNGESIFSVINDKKDRQHFLIPEDQRIIDYLQYKYNDRKLRFVMNGSQIENKLINHVIGLNKQEKVNMKVDVGVIDATTQELLALTQLHLLNDDLDNPRNQADIPIVKAIQNKIKDIIS